MLFREIVAVYCGSRTKRKYKLCGQNEDFCNVGAGCTQGYFCFKGFKSRYSPSLFYFYFYYIPPRLSYNALQFYLLSLCTLKVRKKYACRTSPILMSF
jgi:hypothetical protein